MLLIFVVRYEDLVIDPQEVATKIQSSMGLNLTGFDPSVDWARSTRDFDQFRSDGDAFSTKVYGKGITDSRIGRYREKLTSGELETIECLCAPLMQVFHYLPCVKS